jgi:hypothetical protein
VLRMAGVMDRFQQVLVSAHSAYVFGRTGAGARKADWILDTCLWGKNVFDTEFMRPKVAEVVRVSKPRGPPRDDIL